MLIYLTRGKVTLVDDNIPKVLLAKKYCATLCGDKYYAVTNINGKTIYLHRVLTNAPAKMVVDHINGDTLDNRLENLRVCTTKENIRNQRQHSDKFQKYRGVDFMKQKSRYRARITIDRKEIYLGLFTTPEEAYEVYKKASKELFGNFSNV